MATNTNIPLYSTTLGSPASSVTISSIPQGYTDLRLVVNGGASVYGGFRIRFNGDSGSNYSDTYLLGDGSSPASGRDTSLTYGSAGYPLTTTLISTHTTDFMNYSNTTTYKTSIGRSSDAASITLAQVGLWRSTSAINSIYLYPASGNFLTGTTFNLYGIASEGTSPAPKATGGYITSDSTYYYHTFPATGTFTPLQSLTADILVVAGGGGGGYDQGGGGGAGGLLAYTSQSLSATGYTCTVGSGGASATNGNNSQFGALTASIGGGRGGYYNGNNGLTGGSGGGGGGGNGATGIGGSATSGQGYAGGNGYGVASTFGGGGGGGSAQVGVTAISGLPGAGGNGTSAYSSWLSATGVGQNVSSTWYIAGGGAGGGTQTGYNPTGFGGGGLGGNNNDGAKISGTAAQANTGSGGGGAGAIGGASGGAGGSGIVIVRYLKA